MKKEYLVPLIIGPMIPLLIIIPIVISGIYGHKKQKEYLQLKIEDIEHIQVVPSGKKFRNLNTEERKKNLYYLTDSEIRLLLTILKNEDLNLIEVNLRMVKKKAKLVIKFKDKVEKETIHFFLDESKKTVILELPNGYYSLNNYYFFNELIKKDNNDKP